MSAAGGQGPLSGRRVGPWQLGRRLGQGGMGAVYRSESYQGPVAVKVMTSELEPELLMRFQREAEAAAAVSRHPGVLKIISADFRCAPPWMAFELAGGGTLGDLCGGPLALDELQALARGLAEGLAHLHSEGIVHRDLKPSNVLFREDSRAPLIADFGLARIEGGERLTKTGAMLGTPQFMAPEQVSGQVVTPAADCWAYGAILYLLATGRRPFESPTLPGLYQDIVKRDPARLDSLRPDLPPELASLILACLAKSPEQRPANGAALVNALESGASAMPKTPWSAWILALVIVSAVVLLFGLGIRRHRRDRRRRAQLTETLSRGLSDLEEGVNAARRAVLTALVTAEDPNPALTRLSEDLAALFEALRAEDPDADRESVAESMAARLVQQRAALTTLVELDRRRRGLPESAISRAMPAVTEAAWRSLIEAMDDPSRGLDRTALERLGQRLGEREVDAVLDLRRTIQGREWPVVFRGPALKFVDADAASRLDRRALAEWTIARWSGSGPALRESAWKAITGFDDKQRLSFGRELVAVFRSRDDKTRRSIARRLLPRPNQDPVASIMLSARERPMPIRSAFHRELACQVPPELQDPNKLEEYVDQLVHELQAAFFDSSHVPTRIWPRRMIEQLFASLIFHAVEQKGTTLENELEAMATIHLGAIQMEYGLSAFNLDLAGMILRSHRKLWDSLTKLEKDILQAWCGLEARTAAQDKLASEACLRVLKPIFASGTQPHLEVAVAVQWLRLSARYAAKAEVVGLELPVDLMKEVVAAAMRPVDAIEPAAYAYPNELPDLVDRRFSVSLTLDQRLTLARRAREGARLRHSASDGSKAESEFEAMWKATREARRNVFRDYDSLERYREDVARFSAREADILRRQGRMKEARTRLAEARTLAPFHHEVLGYSLPFCDSRAAAEALIAEARAQQLKVSKDESSHLTQCIKDLEAYVNDRWRDQR